MAFYDLHSVKKYKGMPVVEGCAERLSKVLFSFLFLIFSFACSDRISEEDLKDLNGYWEIVSVEFPNGETKDYNVSTTVDYFQLKGLKGFRKKVQPKLNGTFRTSDDAVSFTILKKDAFFEIYYKNDLNTWTETLIDLSGHRFSVKNVEGVVYSYKRFETLFTEGLGDEVEKSMD